MSSTIFGSNTPPETTARISDITRLSSPLLQDFRRQPTVSTIVIDIQGLEINEALLKIPQIEHLATKYGIRISLQHSIYENMRLATFNPHRTISICDNAAGLKEALYLSCWTIAFVNDQPKTESELEQLRGAHYQIKSIVELIAVVNDINKRLQLGEFPTSSVTSLFTHSPATTHSQLASYNAGDDTPFIALR